MRDLPATICVEVVYADPRRQVSRSIEVGADTTVDQAIRLSGIRDLLPPDFVPAGVGIFGTQVNSASKLSDGDRIELYRPLAIDPKEARRLRVKKKSPPTKKRHKRSLS